VSCVEARCIFRQQKCFEWEKQLSRIKSWESRTRHTLRIHGINSAREITVCTDLLWVKSLAAAFANDNHLRSETAESMVQSVFSHVGSIASDDFWDEESTFAPNKKT
jgi:hypothetical protein